MDETTTAETEPVLAEVPLFTDFDNEPDEAAYAVATERPSRGPALGIYARQQLGSARFGEDLDWLQVVELRRRASEAITEESEHQSRTTGRILLGDDRMLMGRAIIRRVVGDHVRSLHRDGAALWSPAQEESYVNAVEDAVFGYGRLQPLLELAEVENIEIHGWNLPFRWCRRAPIDTAESPPTVARLGPVWSRLRRAEAVAVDSLASSTRRTRLRSSERPEHG